MFNGRLRACVRACVCGALYTTRSYPTWWVIVRPVCRVLSLEDPDNINLVGGKPVGLTGVPESCYRVCPTVVRATNRTSTASAKFRIQRRV